MSKKDKKIEIQIVDSKVTVGKDTFDGFTLSIGKKTIGEIADMGWAICHYQKWKCGFSLQKT